MQKFLQFIVDYKYPLIGALVALIIIFTGLYNLIIPIAVIVACVYGGFYFQKNKEDVKEKIKNLIDKL